jgi:hypothetical protein
MRFFLILALLFCFCAQAEETMSLKQSRTFSAAMGGITPWANPYEICSISGNAATTVRVTRILVSATQSTLGVNKLFLTKRSIALGGLGKSIDVVAHDSKSGTNVTTPKAYPSPMASVSPVPSPTAGVVGDVRVFHVIAPETSPTYGIGSLMTDYNFDMDLTSQRIVLRGAGESLSVNFKGAAVPAGFSMNCSFEWTEE